MVSLHVLSSHLVVSDITATFVAYFLLLACCFMCGSACFMCDVGFVIAVGCDNGQIALVDAESQKIVQCRSLHHYSVYTLIFSLEMEVLGVI